MRYMRVIPVGADSEQMTADDMKTLATYNGERNRGILHDPAWQADMADLQRLFDQSQRWRMEAQGLREIAPGIWARPA